MRGSPLVRALVMLLALAALAIPLRHLTAQRETISAPPVVENKAPETSKVSIALTSTRVPCAFSIHHLGKVIWEGTLTKPEANQTLDLPFPPEGIDLVVQAEWSDEDPSALRVEVTAPGGRSIEQSLWGSGSATEVLTFR